MIRRIMKRRSHGTVWESGYIYTFKYQAWQNDPQPTIILMYALDGTHPNTGHQWRFYQGINFTYIPRPVRTVFARAWINQFERSRGDVIFTWEMVKRQYPYLQDAVRRYFYKPNYYIQKPIRVPIEDMEDVIVSTWSKDFSKKIRTALSSKFRKVIGNRSGGKTFFKK